LSVREINLKACTPDYASNPETIYSAGSGDWTKARLITVSAWARTVPMSHRDNIWKLMC